MPTNLSINERTISPGLLLFPILLLLKKALSEISDNTCSGQGMLNDYK